MPTSLRWSTSRGSAALLREVAKQVKRVQGEGKNRSAETERSMVKLLVRIHLAAVGARPRTSRAPAAWTGYAVTSGGARSRRDRRREGQLDIYSQGRGTEGAPSPGRHRAKRPACAWTFVGSRVTAWWCNPRAGGRTGAGEWALAGVHHVVPPTSREGCCRVLVLGGAARHPATSRGRSST